VSFDIFLQGFRDGDAADGDGDSALTVLEPLITRRETDWVRVTTADGGSDVFGIDEPASGLMFNRISGRAIWSVIFDVARLAGFAVMPVGCSTCVPPGMAVRDLPDDLATDVQTVATGDDLRRLIGAT
jgi:hypothetical protein